MKTERATLAPPESHLQNQRPAADDPRTASKDPGVPWAQPLDPLAPSPAAVPADEDRGHAGPSTGASLPANCPYLAGRPPHGSHHLWPSGANVCYARGSGEKQYGPVSRTTQETCCFGGSERYQSCSDHERALAAGIELPVFEGKDPADPDRRTGDAPHRERRRVRKRHRGRHSPLRRWLRENGRSTLICSAWIVVALVAFAVLLRSMQ